MTGEKEEVLKDRPGLSSKTEMSKDAILLKGEIINLFKTGQKPETIMLSVSNNSSGSNSRNREWKGGSKANPVILKTGAGIIIIADRNSVETMVTGEEEDK